MDFSSYWVRYRMCLPNAFEGHDSYRKCGNEEQACGQLAFRNLVPCDNWSGCLNCVCGLLSVQEFLVFQSVVVWCQFRGGSWEQDLAEACAASGTVNSSKTSEWNFISAVILRVCLCSFLILREKKTLTKFCRIPAKDFTWRCWKRSKASASSAGISQTFEDPLWSLGIIL